MTFFLFASPRFLRKNRSQNAKALFLLFALAAVLFQTIVLLLFSWFFVIFFI